MDHLYWAIFISVITPGTSAWPTPSQTQISSDPLIHLEKMGHGWVFMEHGKSFCITDSTIRKSSGQKLLLGTEAFLVVQFVSHKRPISILYKTLRNTRIIKSLNQSLTFSSPRYCQFHFIGIFFSHQLQSHTLYAMLWNVLFLFEFFNELFGLRLVHTTLRMCYGLQQTVILLMKDR